MASKNAVRSANTGRFLFSSFTMASNGTMVVDRSKLHASEGYKRQVKALDELRQKREKEEPPQR